MTRPNPKRVLFAYRQKTAGEVRFIKDRGSDDKEWGWGSPGPSERVIQEDFIFNPRYLKPLALTMRSALMALGHATSAHARFVKVKSRNVSPDGALGGKGYIQKIPDMRRQLMNTIEALSALTDTLHDELNAPHWNPAEDTLDARDRDEVKEIVDDAEEIREDPEGWAAEQEEEMDEVPGKTASASRILNRYARETGRIAPYAVTPKTFPEFWKTLNEVQGTVIQIQAAARQIGYWSENAAGDLRAESLDPLEAMSLAEEATRLASRLMKPWNDLKRIQSDYAVRPRYASSGPPWTLKEIARGYGAEVLSPFEYSEMTGNGAPRGTASVLYADDVYFPQSTTVLENLQKSGFPVIQTGSDFVFVGKSRRAGRLLDLEQVRLAALAIEPMILAAQGVHEDLRKVADVRVADAEVQDLNFAVTDLVGDLRSARKYLHRVMENPNV
jgi:hypothetical protein